MKIRKIISAALIAAIIILILPLAAACDNNSEGGDKNINDSQDSGRADSNVNGQEQQADGQEQGIISEAPVIDFEGYEFKVLSRDESFGRWYASDIAVAVENGDALNDAAYNRNIIIEDKYNIKIVN